MYTLKLEQFEGPLDLLLHLIEKAKIDIKDIFVSEITGQYIDFIEQNQSNMDDISEFLTMAATLLYIKSKRLVPQKQLEPDEEDLEEQLIFQLEEYRKFKLAANKLKEDMENAPQVYTKYQDEFILTPKLAQLDDITMDQLVDAYQKILQNLKDSEELPDKTAEKVVRRDKYTIKQKMDLIMTRLSVNDKLLFTQLFDEDTRSEVVITFLSVLELINVDKLSVFQDHPYGEIVVARRSVALGNN